MRILRLDSWDGGRGGAQEYISTVTRELEARGHPNLTIRITQDEGAEDPAGDRFVAAPAGGVSRLGFDVVRAPGLEEALRSAVATFHPDLVQLHHFDAGFSSIARAIRGIGVPIVMTAHDAELVCPISTLVRPGAVICEGGIRYRCLFTGCRVGAIGGPYNLWQRRVFDTSVADRVRVYLCPSRSLTDYLHSNGYRPALHLPSFASIPATIRERALPPPSGDEPPTVGYIGRLEWYKGVDDLIRAMGVVHRSIPGARLDIAGEGASRSELERLSAELGLTPSVRFLGPCTGAAKEEFFARTAVVATPSNQWENFPLVALEALVRQRPVVGTAVGGIPEIVEEGVSGHLVPIGRPELLGAALVDLLGAVDRARAWGAEGRRRVLARFTPELHVDRLLAVYRAVLDGSPFSSGGDAAALVGR